MPHKQWGHGVWSGAELRHLSAFMWAVKKVSSPYYKRSRHYHGRSTSIVRIKVFVQFHGGLKKMAIKLWKRTQDPIWYLSFVRKKCMFGRFASTWDIRPKLLSNKEWTFICQEVIRNNLSTDSTTLYTVIFLLLILFSFCQMCASCVCSTVPGILISFFAFLDLSCMALTFSIKLLMILAAI